MVKKNIMIGCWKEVTITRGEGQVLVKDESSILLKLKIMFEN